MTRVLILGGTAEAVALAHALHRARPSFDVITSLAGVTRTPVTGPGRLREGGFGGVDGLGNYLREEAVDVLIDATHPFAATMAGHAALAADKAGVARIKLVRPLWERTPEDLWFEVGTVAEAAQVLRTRSAGSVLMTLGRRDLEAFAGLGSTRFLVRMIEAPGEPLPMARSELILARGPFTPEGEEMLMRDHGIDAVVTKASGGQATQAKILAARNLAIPVIMIRRPAMPEGPSAETVEGVMAWLEQASRLDTNP